jgi:hypothetical protein
MSRWAVRVRSSALLKPRDKQHTLQRVPRRDVMLKRIVLCRALAAGAFAIRALYLNALGLQLRRAARYLHLQYTVLEAGAYLALLDIMGQNKTSAEGAEAGTRVLRGRSV